MCKCACACVSVLVNGLAVQGLQECVVHVVCFGGSRLYIYMYVDMN